MGIDQGRPGEAWPWAENTPRPPPWKRPGVSNGAGLCKNLDRAQMSAQMRGGAPRATPQGWAGAGCPVTSVGGGGGAVALQASSQLPPAAVCLAGSLPSSFVQAAVGETSHPQTRHPACLGPRAGRREVGASPCPLRLRSQVWDRQLQRQKLRWSAQHCKALTPHPSPFRL